MFVDQNSDIWSRLIVLNKTSVCRHIGGIAFLSRDQKINVGQRFSKMDKDSVGDLFAQKDLRLS